MMAACLDEWRCSGGRIRIVIFGSSLLFVLFPFFPSSLSLHIHTYIMMFHSPWSFFSLFTSLSFLLVCHLAALSSLLLPHHAPSSRSVATTRERQVESTFAFYFVSRPILDRIE